MPTPNVETAIWLALRARLEALTLTPALEIAWPKETFTPPTSNGRPDSYLRVKHFPNTTEMATIGTGGDNRHFGIFQITLVAKKLQNAAVDKEIVGDICDWFKVGTAMTSNGVTVRIEQPPSIGSLLEGQNMDETPISIRYYADVART